MSSEQVDALAEHIAALLGTASRIASRDIGGLVADAGALRSLTRSRLAQGEGLEETARRHQAAEDAAPPTSPRPVQWSAEQLAARERVAKRLAAELADEIRERQALYGTRADVFPEEDETTLEEEA
jgi:hypothetical protein